MTAARFLREHWQKKPLLVRGAFPGFADPLSVREVLALARSPDAESRVVRAQAATGPRARPSNARGGAPKLTVLVQDATTSAQARPSFALAFMPRARMTTSW
jgi:50S ribosomal protein L16 3-hydroxylase